MAYGARSEPERPHTYSHPNGPSYTHVGSKCRCGYLRQSGRQRGDDGRQQTTRGRFGDVKGPTACMHHHGSCEQDKLAQRTRGQAAGGVPASDPAASALHPPGKCTTDSLPASPEKDRLHGAAGDEGSPLELVDRPGRLDRALREDDQPEPSAEHHGQTWHEA